MKTVTVGTKYLYRTRDRGIYVGSRYVGCIGPRRSDGTHELVFTWEHTTHRVSVQNATKAKALVSDITGVPVG